MDVDREFRFHSVFACPILKQQATEQNPPVRLVCGHCISKDALHKLSHGNKWVELSGGGVWWWSLVGCCGWDGVPLWGLEAGRVGVVVVVVVVVGVRVGVG